MSELIACRGYISSRPVRGVMFPQKVQNLVIRDYATRNRLRYLLSSAEFAMPGCYMMLDDVLAELPRVGGVILFSAFLLPQRREARRKIYKRVLDSECSLHCALEELVLRAESDQCVLDDLIETDKAIVNSPLAGLIPQNNNSVKQAYEWFTSTIIRGSRN